MNNKDFEYTGQQKCPKLSYEIDAIKSCINFKEKTGEILSMKDGLKFFGVSMGLANIASDFGNEVHNAVVTGLCLQNIGYDHR